MVNLIVDPKRAELHGSSGIYVRATLDGKWGNFDIAELDKSSLLHWLRSRGGDNPWAEDTVGIILGHGHLHEAPSEELKS
jgi:hypothetical protein